MNLRIKHIVFVAAVATMNLHAESVIIEKAAPDAISYVKSVAIKGVENINSKSWTPVSKGNYQGTIECVIDNQLQTVKISLISKGDDSVYYIFSANDGCGYVVANKKSTH